ncbi:UTP--glucose-1-phosphate uridylyltransferase GalU [Dethiobacter alkaliphilus]|uniref:UTP--glucose-1-phosphate uridylyltransferase n=1 Tax=Dethiobacter alkaliphilus AHT 1 TaxID=555088 RepID=C0GHI2_DETAL|nr:UTP--glucose-1-phosphate uridylyltransferase GalU [Dethiobacter alkaliphilus]EEG77188.1 UTP-glucose-1-phosphate uridylyltransferase [Dethiobacter alkaliphilus AHT 1]
MKITKAIIPVAGFGTRFLPITKALPKAMLPVIDKPVIHYLVEEAVASGIEEIIIVVGENKKGIEDYFNRSAELEGVLRQTGKQEMLAMTRTISEMAKISYITQTQPLGLGHAIYCAKDAITQGETFAVLLGDDLVITKNKPCLAQLIDAAKKYSANVVGVQQVPDEMVSCYGIASGTALTTKLIKVEDMVEKPDIKDVSSNLAMMGRYVIHSDIFEILECVTPGKGGEIQLTDALKVLNRKQEIYARIIEGTRYDVGDKLGFLKATTKLALEKEGLGIDYKRYLLELLNKESD